MGAEFELLKAAFFRKQAEPARACFCENCYCAHEVVPRGGGCSASPDAGGAAGADGAASLVAVCRCEVAGCPDIPLTPADVEIWELSRPSLGRSLCRVLALDRRQAELPVHNTCQIGSWSAAAVPVFLTIQTEPEDLRGAIAELVARLQKPFILLAPTAGHLTANCHELLTHAKAGFYALDSTVRITREGSLVCVRAPGEIFAPFTPEPEKDDQQLYIAAVALVRTLETIRTKEPPTVLEVFYRRYVLQQTSAGIAKGFECARATVGNRLRAIRDVLGDKLAGLERYAPHIERILDEMSDSPGRTTYRKGMVGNESDAEG